MNHKGGYAIHLSKPPAGSVEKPSLPDRLHLSRNLVNITYDQLEVETDQKVDKGQILARSSDFFGVTLIAPASGTVSEIDQDNISLSDISCADSVMLDSTNSLDMLWQGNCYRYIRNPFATEITSPGQPENIIVKLVEMDCYIMADEIELMGAFEDLFNGINCLTELVRQKLYIVVSRNQKHLYARLSKQFAGNGKVQIKVIPARYGFDNSKLLARELGLDCNKINWIITSQGVLAAERVLRTKTASTDLWFSLAGPAIKNPCYYNVPVGYPISDLLADNLISENIRVINGGVFSGTAISAEAKGLSGDTTGVTVLDNTPKRKLLKFAWFGFENTRFDDYFTTDIQGELRACVSCGYCQKICPAGLLPDYLHKLLYNDDLDKAEAAGLNNCVDCGLCSFICVSKIELADQFQKARLQIAKEKELLEQEVGK